MKRIALAAVALLALAAVAGVARPEGAHAVDGQTRPATRSPSRERLRLRHADLRRPLVRRRLARRDREGGARRQRPRDARR